MLGELAAATLNVASISVAGFSCIWMMPVRPPPWEPTECTAMLAVSEFTFADVLAASLIWLTAGLFAAACGLPFEQPLIAIAAAPAAAAMVIHRDGGRNARLR